MLPTLREGDLLLVRHGARVGVGDLVVARFPDGTLAVKRAAEERRTRTGEAGWWLLSDNPDAGSRAPELCEYRGHGPGNGDPPPARG